MILKLTIKPFYFHLQRTLTNAQGSMNSKRGWLIHLEDELNNHGWGEVSTFEDKNLKPIKKILMDLVGEISPNKIESQIKSWPNSLAFGIGCAFAEINGLLDLKNNNKVPKSAFLLPSDSSTIETLKSEISKCNSNNSSLTFKIKVAKESNRLEKQMLQQIMNYLPNNCLLRLDANGGWSRQEAKEWANILKGEKRLEWIEQPLNPHDIEGLEELNKIIPIALDESLLVNPSLCKTWEGWQVRHPSLEGDPRPLLKKLTNGGRYIAISTAFETGIGKRWVNYLAKVQQLGPTPTAPGLAPGWVPSNPLFANNPVQVWNAL